MNGLNPSNLYSNSLPRPLHFENNNNLYDNKLNNSDKNHHISNSLPLDYMKSLDPDTVAFAEAAAKAAFQDAIATRTARISSSSTANNNEIGFKETPPRQSLKHLTFLNGAGAPLTPTSPTRPTTLMSPSLLSPYNDAHQSSPFANEFSVASPNNQRKPVSVPRTPIRMNQQQIQNDRNRLYNNDPSLQWSNSPMLIPTSPTGDTSNESEDGEGKDRDSKKMNLYKTELCRSWEETGTCRYGTKCQFAHSYVEVRGIDRHPKYKTEMCKTFWEKGTCPYGKRCCFIHTTKDSTPMSPTNVTPPRQRSNSTSTRPLMDDNGDTPRRSKPVGIFTGKPNGNGELNKSLFDQVTGGFSLWSPTVGSPDVTQAFSFSERSVQESMFRNQQQPFGSVPNSATPFTRKQQNYLDDLNQVDQGMKSFQISSPLNSVPTTNVLTPIQTRFDSDASPFPRSTMSTGISTQPFFNSNDLNFDEEVNNKSQNNQQIGDLFRVRSGASSLSHVPILNTPPMRARVVSETMGFNNSSPIESFFKGILDSGETTTSGHLKSLPVHQRTVSSPNNYAQAFKQQTLCSDEVLSPHKSIGQGSLRKFDSGVNIDLQKSS
ncbi:hypothetical protein HK099_002328 [Clydaea vesicula]|uniref:C3H1-type domain-containing protein n=1 Tax=Clydaea vesicula TaxID=447962 RepID=A0AAD5XRN9_9FUNG|nr:hypothetical protein HK099_002328 [Clydaea vesicula]